MDVELRTMEPSQAVRLVGDVLRDAIMIFVVHVLLLLYVHHMVVAIKLELEVELRMFVIIINNYISK